MGLPLVKASFTDTHRYAVCLAQGQGPRASGLGLCSVTSHGFLCPARLALLDFGLKGEQRDPLFSERAGPLPAASPFPWLPRE